MWKLGGAVAGGVATVCAVFSVGGEREGGDGGGGIVQSAAGSALSNEYNFKQSNCVWRQTPS